MKFYFSFILFALLAFNCQETDNTNTTQQKEEVPVTKVILMIGDGMGTAQVYAAYTANRGSLQMERAPVTGFVKTNSASDYITDSGAGGTAYSSGNKTVNTYVGMDTSRQSVPTLLELAEAKGMATGLVATSSIAHATPAAFIAHQEYRYNYDEIAADFVGSGVDIFIGGGRKHFENHRYNHSEELRKENYSIVYTLEDIDLNYPGNIGCLASEDGMPKMIEGRGDFLPDATLLALDKLDNNDKGFFLMVEGSQIDWACHDNDIDYLLGEVLDFDKTVGLAFDYADKNPGTLVIVTADHETGGLSLTSGNIGTGELKVNFGTGNHTGVMVPLFAYGTGVEEFTGMYENTEVFEKIKKILEF